MLWLFKGGPYQTELGSPVVHGREMGQLKGKRLQMERRQKVFTMVTVKLWDWQLRETACSLPSDVFKSGWDKALSNLPWLLEILFH